jgi:DNA polymerase III gamma/tau subunit
MLSKAAQSVLLKTLEEGVGQTCFILVTTDADKLLATIRSRCVQVNLTPVDRSTVVKHLEFITKNEQVEAEESAIKLIVEHTYGHIRDALNLAQQMSLAGPITLEITKKHLNLHIDEQAANVIILCGENWTRAVEETEIIAQENAPEEIWASMRRAISHAVLMTMNPIKEKLIHAIHQLADLYSPRLLSTCEWTMGEGSRLQIRTTSDLTVALAILREKLGANLKVKVEGVKPLGPPKKTMREASFGRVQQLLKPEEVAEGLMLTLDTDQDPSKE